jgi:hypothetical protein
MIAWNEALPPITNQRCLLIFHDDLPMCHWKRAASTSTEAPFSVSMQLTDFSKILSSVSQPNRYISAGEALRFSDVV